MSLGVYKDRVGTGITVLNHNFVHSQPRQLRGSAEITARRLNCSLVAPMDYSLKA